jgi:hypothetical protein
MYILYFYLTGAGVVPNLAATPAASPYAHPLRQLSTVVTTVNLSLSN